MAISLTGLTLHVADVDRARDFYMRIPGAVLVLHHPGNFALIQIREFPRGVP
jgi:catechol 2,3-dioxygenase-like lactoylglutathione lyase family enzyme